MIGIIRKPSHRMAISRYGGLAALLIGASLCVVGSFSTGLLKSFPFDASEHNALIVVVIALIAVVSAWIFKLRVANAACIVTIVLAIRCIGLSEVSSALLILSSASVIGYPLSKGVGKSGRVISMVCGLAVLAGVDGWLLPFKVHSFLVYFTVLGAVSVVGRRIVVQNVRLATNAWRRAVNKSPLLATFGVVIIALALLPTFLPSIQYDDLAYHLSLPGQLLSAGYYRMDVATQSWALAPWASDVLHAYVAVLSGEVSHGAMNAAILVLIAAMLWVIGDEIGLSQRFKWLSILLYVTIPIVSQLNGCMQADSAITLATVTLVALTAKVVNRKDARLLVPFMVVSGFLMALKVTGGLLVAPLTIVVFMKLPKVQFIRRMLALTPLALMLCGSSYYCAWFLTGNPIFPLYNALFRSSYAPATNFNDYRWHAGVSWHSVWDMTFYTQHYQEVHPGAFGFTVLALAGCLLFSLMRRRWRLLMAGVIFNVIAMFFAIQYTRYIIPPVSALIPFSLLAIQPMASLFAAEAILCLITVFNAAFIPNSLWIYVQDVNWKLAVNLDAGVGADRALIEREYAPEIIASRFLELKYNGQYTLYLATPESPFAGAFYGRAIAASSYDPEFSKAATIANKDPSGQAWLGLMERTGITQVITSHTINVGLHEALRKANAVDELTIGDDTLWSLCRTACAEHASPLLEARDLSGYLRP